MPKGLDGLMSVSVEARTEFLETIMENVQPAFRITQPGDPARMRQLKATLPNAANTYKLPLIDHTRLLLKRSEVKGMRADLLDIEMSLCGGG